MDEFLVFNMSPSYGITLNKARHLTAEEKEKYQEPYWNTLFIVVEPEIPLEHIGWTDRPNRPIDGAFPGSGNSAWIISQEEWTHYLELEAEREEKQRAKELESNIKALKSMISRMERSELCKTMEEAKEKARQYSDAYNEGGEGYVPHFYTVDDYKKALAYLKELETYGTFGGQEL